LIGKRSKRLTLRCPQDREPQDAESFAARLVSAGKLTPYQAQQLLSNTVSPKGPPCDQ
jgi:hypothetical protein